MKVSLAVPVLQPELIEGAQGANRGFADPCVGVTLNTPLRVDPYLSNADLCLNLIRYPE